MAFMLEEIILSLPLGVHIGFIAVLSDRVCPFLFCVAKTPFNTSFDRYKVSCLHPVCISYSYDSYDIFCFLRMNAVPKLDSN